jgi:hypothetical protein
MKLFKATIFMASVSLATCHSNGFDFMKTMNAGADAIKNADAKDWGIAAGAAVGVAGVAGGAMYAKSHFRGTNEPAPRYLDIEDTRDNIDNNGLYGDI